MFDDFFKNWNKKKLTNKKYEFLFDDDVFFRFL